MIRQLRRKIFWSIELSAIGVLFLILLFYNGIQYSKSQQEKWQMLSAIADNTVEMVPDFEETEAGREEQFGREARSSKEEPFGREEWDSKEEQDSWAEQDSREEWILKRGRERGHRGTNTTEIVKNLVSGEIGIVEVDSFGKELSVSGFLKGYEEDDRQQLLDKITATGSEQGTINGMKYLLYTDRGETFITILDSDYIDGDVLMLAGISLFGLLMAGIVFGVFARRLALRIVKPVEETIRGQKQFIADASHELKTPVAVISANISVLEKEMGTNRWLDYMKEEERRMTGLINDLLQLSKLDYEADSRAASKEGEEAYSLSDAVLEAALPFESIAFEKEIAYELQVPENLLAYGRREDIIQMVGILLDNALKHTERNGTVSLSVRESLDYNKKKAKGAKSALHSCLQYG